MSRPVHADAEATRQKILDAACSLFSKAGHGSTSMRDIARDAGVSQATVHHYFGNKDALYRACADAMYGEVQELQGELLPALTSGGTFDEVLELVVRRAFRFTCSRRPAIRMVMRDVIDSGSLDPEWRGKLLLPFLDGASLLLAPMANVPAASLRLILHSFQYIVIRYALADPAELAVVCGLTDQIEAVAAIEDHLVALARRMLRGAAPA